MYLDARIGNLPSSKDYYATECDFSGCYKPSNLVELVKVNEKYSQRGIQTQEKPSKSVDVAWAKNIFKEEAATDLDQMREADKILSANRFMEKGQNSFIANLVSFQSNYRYFTFMEDQLVGKWKFSGSQTNKKDKF